jgi:alkanesulfonate monooxygenase SsuD/methylene tetrahydromethanopterin reductase-like flavin-dependent oxidoreductase (luciferase family)
VVVFIADSIELGRQELARYSGANYGLPLEELEAIQAVVTGPPEQVAARLARYVDAGARHLVCRIGANDLGSAREQLQLLAGLIPHVRRP